MGGRIAKRIANTDIATIVYDTRASACAELALCGAQVASDAAAVARGAEVVCICVVDDEQVIGVVTQLRGELNNGSVVMVHSSVAPDTVRAVAATLAPAGILVVDAPVSGSRPAATARTVISDPQEGSCDKPP